MLAPVMAVLSLRQRRALPGTAASQKKPPLVPFFVVAFIACAALRSAGFLPDFVILASKSLQTGLLTAAMFALGTGVRLQVLRAVGPRPFVLAAASTAWVASIALVGVMIVN